MGQLFGTDGVRGAAGRELTAGLAMALAAAAANVLSASEPAPGLRQRPFAVVGRDPRASGEFLESAVVAGLAASGVDVVRLGVIPTPAVAHLTAALGAEFGVMLSASHNPAPDNGIKFFARGGMKLPDAVEGAIEARLTGRNGQVLAGGRPLTEDLSSAAMASQGLVSQGPAGVPAAGFGRVTDAPGQGEHYVQHLLSTVVTRPGAPGRPLAGLRVVVDCAHGAASRYAPDLLRRAGAEVIAIGADPDGLNINAGWARPACRRCRLR